MKRKHLVAAVAAIFATGAIAAGTGQPAQSQSQGAMSQSQGGQSRQAQAHDPQVVRQVQEQLKQKGFDVGAVDGVWGPKTQQGLKQFQQSQNIQASGELDQQTLSALGIDQQSSATGGSAPGASGGGGPSGSGSSEGGASSGGGGGSGPGGSSGGGSSGGGG